MDASVHVGAATKHFAQQAGVDRRPVDEKDPVRVLIDWKRRHGKRSARAEQVAQQVDHVAGAQGNVIELVPRRLDPQRSARRHPQIDQLLPQIRDRNRTPVDFFRKPELLSAQDAAKVALTNKLLDEALDVASDGAGHAGGTIYFGGESFWPDIVSRAAA